MIKLICYISIFFVQQTSWASNFSVYNKHDDLAHNQPLLQDNLRKYQKISKQQKDSLDGITKKINIICTSSALTLSILPYSLNWIVDQYFPDKRFIVDALHYQLTPIGLIGAEIMVAHNYVKAKNRLIKAETRLSKAHKFFKHFIITKQSLKNQIDTNDDFLEEHLYWLISQNTPTGKMLLAIKQSLERKGDLKISKQNQDKKDCIKYIYHALEQAITQPTEEYLTKGVLLEFNGLALASYYYLDLKTIVKEAGSYYRHNSNWEP